MYLLDTQSRVAIIVATQTRHDLIVVTRNECGFLHFEVKVSNPFVVEA